MTERSDSRMPKLIVTHETAKKWDIDVDLEGYKAFLQQQGISDDAIERLSVSFLYEEETTNRNYGYYDSYKKNISLYFRDLEHDCPGTMRFDDAVNEGFLHETAHFIDDMSGRGDRTTRQLERTVIGFMGAAYSSVAVVGAGVLHHGYSRYRSDSTELGSKLIRLGIGGAALTALAWKFRTSSFYHDWIDPAEQFAYGFADKYQDNRFVTLHERKRTGSF